MKERIIHTFCYYKKITTLCSPPEGVKLQESVWSLHLPFQNCISLASSKANISMALPDLWNWEPFQGLEYLLSWKNNMVFQSSFFH